MATIAITGATGTVGQACVPRLKQGGHRLIYLVRGENPEQRIREVLGQYVTEEDRFLSCDITRPLGAVPSQQIRDLREHVDHFLHLAGSTKFYGDDEETRKMNVGGTRNMLLLAEELGCPTFHHMSTAYVAGYEQVFGESDMDCEQINANAYERSKLQAERLVRIWRGSKRIYRMSIMTGDSETGAISAFSGYYGFFTSFWLLLSNLRKTWQRDPDRLTSHGISFQDEKLILPLTMRCSHEARLNLIPSDWLADTLTNLMFAESPHLVHHLVHQNPPRVRDVIEQSLDHMGITGLRYGQASASDPAKGLLNKLQKQLDKGLEPFVPYVTHSTNFTSTNTQEVLGSRYVSPPPVDRSFYATMLDYAMRANFGRKVRVPTT